ncbi:hypothetical protein [Psychrobacillus sp. NPDC093180]|uniref:hypothetical protein n=1 Tax=Psychrobacillus sp. NPDC093180 TaxID=3364489 RepID=UPI0038190D90
MEDMSRVTRKREEKKSKNQKWKSKGVATFKLTTDLVRVIDWLLRNWNDWTL